MNTLKDSFCSYCGSEFPDNSKYPRNCVRCGTQTWSNPLPVVVVMLPVEQDGKLGLLIQQRNIEPQKGNWALTGGYIDNGEDWRSAAARETMEELGLVTDPAKFQLYDVVGGKHNTTLLVVCVYEDTFHASTLKLFVPNEEVQAVDVMWEPRELAFPSHTQAANDLLKSYIER